MKTVSKDKNRIPDYELLFQEGTESKDEKKGKKMGGILKLLFKQNSGKLFVTTFLYVVQQLPSSMIPLVTAEIINTITAGGEGAMKRILLYGLAILALLAPNLPTNLTRNWFSSRMQRNISAGLRNTLIRKLQHLSITYHNEIERGRIQSKFLRDIEAIEALNTRLIDGLLPTMINLLVSIVVSVTKSWKVTLFFALLVPVNILTIRFFRKGMIRINRRLRKENENISAKVTDMMGMIPVTKAHGLENEEISSIEGNIETLRDCGIENDKLNAYFNSCHWILSQTMSAVCLIVTAFLALRGDIQVGDVVLYNSYFASISAGINALISIFPEITKGLESISSLAEVVLSNNVENNSGKIKLRYVHGTVNFDNAYYRYPGGNDDIIKNFTLAVEPGECVAFVGSSGSGKSTIMNMIIGFLKPTKGTLRIDGKPIDALNLSDYRHFISVVPQNSILFTGSIRDNITYGLHSVPEEVLDRVVHLANIYEFTKDLPDGLDTIVGENGANLSGGQKQRISIARALIRDPKILILDEATSALDNISEYQVQKAINHLTQGRTTFVVAHRLSTIRNADKIIVMENGQCVEMGTYEELMLKKGKFFELKTLNDINMSTDPSQA
ncbi:MAG: ABC transporter ATP-binding protein [Clostridia bacterium]|nr:ABC transporter ATP-binding protein [Clostridia bacterium]